MTIKPKLEDLHSVFCDWKDAPESIIEEINDALDARKAGFRFGPVDGGGGDSCEFVLLSTDEECPTSEEWQAYLFGDDDED